MSQISASVLTTSPGTLDQLKPEPFNGSPTTYTSVQGGMKQKKPGSVALITFVIVTLVALFLFYMTKPALVRDYETNELHMGKLFGWSILFGLLFGLLMWILCK